MRISYLAVVALVSGAATRQPQRLEAHELPQHSLRMAAKTDTTTDARLAARATLLVLRTIAPQNGAPAPTRYVVSPGRQAVSLDSAVTLVLLIPRPMACGAHVGDTAVFVDCRAMVGQELASWKGWADTSITHQADIMRANHPGPTEMKLLVEGVAEALVLPLSSYANWKTNYHLIQPHAEAIYDNDSAASAAGAQAGIRLQGALTAGK